jgi:hypothetical protein
VLPSDGFSESSAVLIPQCHYAGCEVFYSGRAEVISYISGYHSESDSILQGFMSRYWALLAIAGAAFICIQLLLKLVFQF